MPLICVIVFLRSERIRLWVQAVLLCRTCDEVAIGFELYMRTAQSVLPDRKACWWQSSSMQERCQQAVLKPLIEQCHVVTHVGQPLHITCTGILNNASCVTVQRREIPSGWRAFRNRGRGPVDKTTGGWLTGLV